MKNGAKKRKPLSRVKALPTFFVAFALTAALCAHAADNAPEAKARIVTENTDDNVVLTGRDGPVLKYRKAGSSSSKDKININDIKFANFELDFDMGEINKAVWAREWGRAATLIVPQLLPVLDYLDIPNNNAADAAFSAGNYLLKSGIKLSGCGLSEEARNKGMDQFKRAKFVYDAVAKADWYANSEPAAMKAVLCLVYMGRTDDARENLESVREPMHWDAAYGLYWLTLAHLEFADAEYTTALNNSVQSLAFETKDMDVFPNALALSARCYEETLDWHRARDVYYEVARLFDGTEWKKFAIGRLKAVLPQAKATEEASRVEKVFFGTEEDMNTKVEEYLKSLEDGEKNKETGE